MAPNLHVVDQEIQRLPLSEDLLKYYKSRIERNEQEQADLISRINDVKISNEEHHRLIWELHSRMNDIADLQGSMSELQVVLVRERKQLLQVIAENDELKVQGVKDRRKIQYLLKLTGSHESDLDGRIGGAARRKDIDLERLPLDTEKYDNLPTPPAHEFEAMKLTVTSLRAQLEEQRKLYEDMLETKERDRVARRDEENLRWQQETEKCAEMISKCEKLDGFCRENTRELLQVKKDMLARERAWQEERARLLEELESLQSSFSEEKGRVENVERNAETKVYKKYELMVSELKRKNLEREEETKQLRAKLEHIETTTKKHIEALQKKLEVTTTNHNNLKKRRALDLEGFTTDIANIRRQIKQLERSVLKYAPVDDRELNLLVLARETGEQVNKIAEELHNAKGKVVEAERDLRHIVV